MNNGSPKKLPKAWWRALLDAKVVATDTTKAPLVDFLINMVSIAKLKPLFAQLLTQASQYIEVILLTIFKRGFRDEFSVDASFADPFAWGQVPRVLDHELLRRMVALREHCANKTRFYISTDKANVNTISLMNTLMSVEQVAEVLPPQALPLVSIKRLAREFTNLTEDFAFPGKWRCINHTRPIASHHVYAPTWPLGQMVHNKFGALCVE